MNNRWNPVSWAVLAIIVVVVALLVWMFVPASAEAQSAQSGSTSSSSSGVNATTSAGASVNGVNSSVTFNTPGETRSTSDINSDITYEQRSSGTTTIRNAPPVQAPSMSSGHPCGLAQSGGISIIGGGGAWGQSSSDDACLLGQMGLTSAAVRMIAARNPEACKQLRAAGNIPAGSICSHAEKRALAKQQQAAATSPQPTANPLAGNVTCERDSAGRLTRIVIKRGVDHAAARAYCG